MLPRLMGFVVLVAIALVIICVGGTAWLIRGIMRPPRKTYAQALRRGNPTDPADLEMQAVETWLTLSDETRSPGWIIAGRVGDDPTVVVVHGFGDSRYGALTWAPLLSPFASRVVVFDLPGHGEAQAKNSLGGLREAADVLAVIDQVAPEGGVVLMGYSLGAQIAIAAAALAAEQGRPGMVAGVIADGPYRYWAEPIVRLLRAEHYPRQPFVFLAECVFRLTIAGFKDFDRAGKAARMVCPLLVLHGTEDEICPYESGKQIAAAAPRAELVTFEGGHHLDLAGADPQRYREALSRFFAELVAKAGSWEDQKVDR